MNDLDIAAVGPAQLLQRVQERVNAILSFGVVRGQTLQHTYTPYAL